MKKTILTLAVLLLPLSNIAAATDVLTGNKFVDGVLSTIIYSLIGIVMAVIAFRVVDILTPGDLSKSLVDDKHLPLSVVAGSLILGISIIIAASVVG